MDLKEFISTTLTQVVEGVKAAQGGDLGDHISPRIQDNEADYKGHSIVSPMRGPLLTIVDFDVAVTASESGGADAGIRVAVWGVGGGVEGSRASENIAVNRIKFSVPVALPVSEDEVPA